MKQTNTRRKVAQGTHLVQVGETTIPFALFHANRKTLSIRIHPDRRIEVSAPTGTPYAVVEAFVRDRSRWIAKHLAAIAEQPPAETTEAHRFITGEIYHYLGTAYPLLVEADAITRIVLTNDRLRVGVHDPANIRQVQTMVARWYRLHTERIFQERLAVCLPLIAPLNIRKTPQLAIRQMKTRWGSCTAAGKITLNLNLIQASLPLIDYVLLHELCHLKEMNHSPRFWALVTQVCPDWRPRRKALNQAHWPGVPTI